MFRPPLAGLWLRPWYDNLAMRALTRWYFPLSRAWAAALASGGAAEEFCRHIPGHAPPSALSAVARHARAYDAAQMEWDRAFFSDAAISEDRLRQAEDNRLGRAQALMLTRARFIPMQIRGGIPPVRWQLAATAEVRRQYGEGLADPANVFQAPSPMPAFERSHPFHHRPGAGPETSWLRFAAPGGPAGDTAWARVIAPPDSGRRPVLILAHGIGIETEFWRGLARAPEALMRAGVCLIHPEGPYHGRRRMAGFYGGEPIISRGVPGLLDYFSRHAAELAALIGWARATFGGPVALGGISLGALTAQRAAAAAMDWPAEVRPDALLLVATARSVISAAFDGDLARAVGVPAALEESGWTRADVEAWAPLMEVSGPPPVAPEKIIMTLGSADGVTPFEEGMELARMWGVPRENLFVQERGHFTTSLGIMADESPLRRLVSVLGTG